MQFEEYKYYLRAANGANYDYYYVNSSGAVAATTSATPVNPLTYAPDGWQKQALMFERGFFYYGIMSSHSFGLTFVKDGAKICRDKFYNDFVEAKLELYIEILNGNTLAYSPYYQGEIDYNGGHDTDDGIQVEVAEGGFISKLTSREKTTFEIPISSNASKIWVRIPPFSLAFRQKWVGANGEIVPKDLGNVGRPNLGALSLEGKNFTYELTDQSPTNLNVIKNKTAATQSFELEHFYDCICEIQSIGGAQPGFFQVGYYIFDETGAFSSETILYSHATAQAVGTTTAYSGTVTFSPGLAPNYYLGMFARSYPQSLPPGSQVGLNASVITQGNSTLVITDDQDTREGYIETLRWHDVFDQLVKEINGSSSITVTSTLLSSTHADKVLSSFDAGRNLPNAVLKTNFVDFFESTNAQLNVAFMYDKTNNVAKIEAKAEAYVNTQIADIGEVVDVDITPLTEEMYVKGNFGQNNYTYDEANGKDEACTLAEYLFPFTKIKSEKDLRSTYRFDPYGIVLNFLNLEGKDVSESSNDNDVFGLHIETTPAGTIPNGFPGAGQTYYDIYKKPLSLIPGPGYWDVQNIYAPDKYFNFFYTPANAIRRHGDYISSLLYGLGSASIKFQSNPKSNQSATKLFTDDGANVINEGADIPVTDLASPIFKPYVWECGVKVPVNLYSVMYSNPYGYIRYKYLGYTWDAFALKVAQSPVQGDRQRFRLLSVPSTDVTKLIR